MQNGSTCKEKELANDIHQTEISITNYSHGASTSQLTQRKKTDTLQSSKKDVEEQRSDKQRSWRRILLLIIAITIHNIPGDCLGYFYLLIDV